MALPNDIVSQFHKLTRYPLAEYLNQFVDFIDVDRNNILEYYSGNVDVPNKTSFEKLNNLLKHSSLINDTIENYRDRMNNGAYWELVELLSNIEVSLSTIENSSKWLRSTISKNNFTPQVELNYVLKQLETLEDASVKSGSNDKDNDWVTIALRNDLEEELYTPDGGNSLLIGYQNKLTVRLQSVVDNVVGEKAYGLDFNKKLTFNQEGLEVLGYKETMSQSVNVLANLRQGNTPEFPQDGIQSELVVGSNRAAIAYPVLFRQFYATFRRDDTLKALRITNIENTQEALLLDFSVETRLGEEIEQTTQL
jgi:hypothetical protein